MTSTPPLQPPNTANNIKTSDSHASTMSELMRQHKQNTEQLKRKNEEKYRKACQSAATASTTLVTATNKDVMEIFSAEQQIEGHVKELQNQTEIFEKKMNQWSQFFVKFNKELKEVGDLANWSTYVEKDVRDTIVILDEVSQKKRVAMGIEKK